MKKYVIIATVCNRLEFNSEQSLNNTITSLKKSGLWESGIDFKLVLHDSGSNDTSYLDEFKDLENVIIVKSKQKVKLTENSISALKYVKENLQADYIISIEDDILFCKNWIQNVDAWIEKNITDEDGFFSFYSAYNNKNETDNFVYLDIFKYYGTQCFGFSFNKMDKYLDYVNTNGIGHYAIAPDLFLSKVFNEIYGYAHIKLSYPCLVQHVGKKNNIKF